MLGSARALARFYAALTSGSLIGADTLKRAATPQTAGGRTSTGSLDGESTQWGLGLQVGTASSGSSGRRAAMIGHRGMGGSVGLSVLGADLSVAVTVSKLSSKRGVTNRLLELIMDECGGWKALEGL